MSEAHPLTEKALQKIRAIGEGNGLAADKIELIGTEEKEFTLRAEMHLSLDVATTRQRYPGPAHAAKRTPPLQALGSVKEIGQRVEEMKKKLKENSLWIKETVEQLKKEPGQGFGIEQAEITLDPLQELFSAPENCQTCHGQGTLSCTTCQGRGTVPCKICQATGQELCPHCQGTGKDPAQLPPPCPTCQGRGFIPQTVNQNCPICHGRGSVQVQATQNCPVCFGRGTDPHNPGHQCQTCHGRGSVQTMAQQPCSTCHGRGTVQNTVQQPCQVCHGKGTLLLTAANQRNCPICQGQMRIPCRTCSGKKQVACTVCQGKGRTSCKDCSGQGKFTVEEKALPTAQCSFHILESAELPSGLRRALDRGGFKLLAKINARIVMEAAQETDNKSISIPYTASFPFADARLRINGKPMRAAILGERASIRDIPPFLDPVFEAELGVLEKKISQSRTLDKALKLRAMRDLFGLMLRGGDAIAAFRKLYPIGFSVSMIERMQGLLQKLVQERTLMVRASAAGFSMLVLCGIFYGVIASGIRQMVARHSFPAAAFILDGLICGLSFLFVNFALRFAAATHLRSLTRQNERVSFRAQRAGSLGIAVGICAILFYMGLLWFLKATPGFFG